jgi:energy-coupling factor transporter transmembrane protein EcfT
MVIAGQLYFYFLLIIWLITVFCKVISKYFADCYVSILLLLTAEIFFFLYTASYVLKLHQFQDYFKEEEKFCVDESKRCNRKKNKNNSVPSGH